MPIGLLRPDARLVETVAFPTDHRSHFDDALVSLHGSVWMQSGAVHWPGAQGGWALGAGEQRIPEESGFLQMGWNDMTLA